MLLSQSGGGNTKLLTENIELKKSLKILDFIAVSCIIEWVKVIRVSNWL